MLFRPGVPPRAPTASRPDNMSAATVVGTLAAAFAASSLARRRASARAASSRRCSGPAMKPGQICLQGSPQSVVTGVRDGARFGSSMPGRRLVRVRAGKDDDLEAPQPSSASPKPEPPKRAQSLREKALSGGAEFIASRSRTAPTHSASERRSSGHVCVRAGKARRHRALPKRS